MVNNYNKLVSYLAQIQIEKGGAARAATECDLALAE
jgi:hypothetical protein